MSATRGYARMLWMAAVVGSAAGAEEPAPAPGRAGTHHRFVEACQADATRLCRDAGGGDGALARCLGAHRNEVSPACRTALRRARRISAFRAACGADVARLCSGVTPGDGRIRDCLRAGAGTLGPACQKRLARGAPGAADASDAALADEATLEGQQGLEPLGEDSPAEVGEAEKKERP